MLGCTQLKIARGCRLSPGEAEERGDLRRLARIVGHPAQFAVAPQSGNLIERDFPAVQAVASPQLRQPPSIAIAEVVQKRQDARPGFMGLNPGGDTVARLADETQAVSSLSRTRSNALSLAAGEWRK